MADTVSALAARTHEILVALLTDGPSGSAAATSGIQDVMARAAALGPDGAWLVASGHATFAGLAVARGEADQAIFHFDAAVTSGFNDCVALHMAPLRPLHHDPRFQALYQRMRITSTDLDELFWLHREMQTAMKEAQQASVDNVGRLDTGVSLLPQVPMPTREPHTAGVLITRIDLAATQTALRQAALRADFQRTPGTPASASSTTPGTTPAPRGTPGTPTPGRPAVTRPPSPALSPNRPAPTPPSFPALLWAHSPTRPDEHRGDARPEPSDGCHQGRCAQAAVRRL
ncbi:hypothetical protein LG634_09275 [Streptomyces bambusae]|uniref:hypothetical protein n=1 Tax=Streptomyces bambusae TaxID=1550616 RepID=UPI001CFD9778|nr:hypothetical protein [Streptomyces bambusae]MCB5165017.1 hypothetical protein [Streptomyces bambusae]